MSYDIAVQFADIMNKKGSEIIVIDTDEVGGHNVVPQPVIIGNYSYMGKNYPLNKTVDDMYLFFCKYLRRAARYVAFHSVLLWKFPDLFSAV